MFFQVLTTLGQIHCILPFALKRYLTCHLLITFANGLDPDQAQHSVQAWSGSSLFAKVISRWQCEVEPMYFIFCAKPLHADNPFKQFGPRSGLTFCLDLIGVQTVWHFRGYDKLKLNRCILTLLQTFTLQCHLLITLSNNFDPDQTIWTQIRPDILSGPYRGPNCLTL